MFPLIRVHWQFVVSNMLLVKVMLFTVIHSFPFFFPHFLALQILLIGICKTLFTYKCFVLENFCQFIEALDFCDEEK